MKTLISKIFCVALMLAPLAASWAGPVDINTADAQTIARELDGIGLSRAQAIVSYREQHGRFTTVDAVGMVKGVGPKILEMNRGNIRVHAQEK